MADYSMSTAHPLEAAWNNLPAAIRAMPELSGLKDAISQALQVAAPEGEREAFEAACKRAHGPRWRGIMRALDPMVAAWEVWQARSAPAGEPTDTQRDAERYRWLRGEVHGPHIPLAQVVWKLHGIRDSSKWTNLSDGKALDEHIDAALSAGSQKQTGETP
jgi:hypothetical protein